MSVTLSDTAKSVLQEITSKTENYLRLTVRSKGCAGLIYDLHYMDEKNTTDDEVVFDGFSLFLDSDRLMYLIGTHIDHMDDLEGKRFVFSNHGFNKCGCGHSFRIGDDE